MDQTLHGVKLTYFVLFGALSLYAPYVSVNLDAAGFTKSQIGSICMMMLLVGMICQPLWGSYADKMGDRLRLGRLLLLGTLLRCAALLVAAATDVNTGNRVMIVMCMFVCAEGVMCGCLPVIDARVLSVLGDERRSLYGRQRLWGGIGWGLMAPVGGWMLGQYGLLATLCGHVVGMCVGMVCVSSLSGQGVSSVGTKGGVDSGRVVSLSEGISAVLSSPGVKSFLCVAVGIVSVSCSVPLTLCM